MKAQTGSRGIAVLFLDPGASWGWVVSTTPRPHYPRERPGAHCIGFWMSYKSLEVKSKILVVFGEPENLLSCCPSFSLSRAVFPRSSLFCTEDEDSTILRNVAAYLPSRRNHIPKEINRNIKCLDLKSFNHEKYRKLLGFQYRTSFHYTRIAK
jgi:hypothetical protein